MVVVLRATTSQSQCEINGFDYECYGAQWSIDTNFWPKLLVIILKIILKIKLLNSTVHETTKMCLRVIEQILTFAFLARFWCQILHSAVRWLLS